jgi:TRAP-type transport system small permease protein
LDELNPESSRPAGLFDQALGLLCAVPLALIVTLTFADVFARYVFSAPIRGSVEIIEYAMAMTIFTAMPLITKHRGHVSVSLIDGLVHGGVRRAKAVVCDLISACALGLTTWRLWEQAVEAMNGRSATLVLGWLHAPLYFAMAAFCAASTVFMLGLGWHSVHDPKESL